ncbi:cyclase-like protein 2 [Hibiscus syriacus]|uniref:cyclase-like protein 2 n=1 Tax=Hibiscus syriacus TaxID=106335 RepID=UPI0019206BF7|nr:cyclase-like protein 2 [Hibiscus syriacus]
MEVPNVSCVDGKGLGLKDDNLDLTTEVEVTLGLMAHVVSIMLFLLLLGVDVEFLASVWTRLEYQVSKLSVLWLPASMKNGSRANNSLIKFVSVHTGTHVDAPGHMIDRYFDSGLDVDTLDLEVLNGPALLVDVPRNSNITAQVMKSLNIPKGVCRVLFRTLNTDRQLMFKREFDSSYVGFTTDGARWLVKNTDIKLVGIDFLSAASYDHLVPAHLEFFEGRVRNLLLNIK